MGDSFDMIRRTAEAAEADPKGAAPLNSTTEALTVDRRPFFDHVEQVEHSLLTSDCIPWRAQFVTQSLAQHARSLGGFLRSYLLARSAAEYGLLRMAAWPSRTAA
jgi:hypothetical protein